MQAEKGNEGHAKTLSLTVQTGSHEEEQGASGQQHGAAGRQADRGPTAGRPWHLHNFPESQFHQLYNVD